MIRFRLSLILPLLLTFACSSPVPDFCDEQTPCDDTAKPYCDLNGEYAASEFIGRTCIPYPWDAGAVADASSDARQPDAEPAACVASTTVCEQDRVVVCSDAGLVMSTEDCSLGCHGSEARCVLVDPSNELASELDAAASAPDIVLTSGATVDTDSGAVTNGDGTGVAVPSSLLDGGGRPVGILVLRVGSLDVDDLTVMGSRALAIVSYGGILLRGNLSLSAAPLGVQGAGAMPAGGACVAGQGVSNADPAFAGGGGGGFGTAGGAGGGAGSLSGGASGSANGSGSMEPLRGGCPGALGGVPSAVGDAGGAAGGALQLVSRTSIHLQAGASISANGGAGGTTRVDFCFMQRCAPGNGGGAGGGILLESPSVTIAASAGAFANGGGGHCGLGRQGEPGQLSDVAGKGTDCTDLNETGSGGDGAAGTVPARVGGTVNSGTAPHGGGGGGGAGRIRVNVPSGTSFSPQGVISPTATVGVLQTR